MKVAYIDTSCLVSVAFGERGASKLAREISRFDELISSNLLEAELRNAFAREKVTFSDDLLSLVSWVLPGRSLGSEFRAVL